MIKFFSLYCSTRSYSVHHERLEACEYCGGRVCMLHQVPLGIVSCSTSSRVGHPSPRPRGEYSHSKDVSLDFG
jgi:hypothetical protein